MEEKIIEISQEISENKNEIKEFSKNIDDIDLSLSICSQEISTKIHKLYNEWITIDANKVKIYNTFFSFLYCLLYFYSNK